MMKVDHFTFNPFQENTYVLSDESLECIIIDPGCYNPAEKDELFQFIQQQKLKPVRLINTHCHIDHVLGNNFIAEAFDLQLELHLLEIPLLRAAAEYGPQFDIYLEPVKEPLLMIKENTEIVFGKSKLQVLHTPGHSPGSLTFVSHEDRFIVSGDVLFRQGIGRTDLPGGNYNTLIKSIDEKLFTLPDDYKVYSGHGPATTIGFEKKNNPFF
ncbi:MAG TPA: MBL fold metallo-hydrolase [Bacteroidia bacterium]|nr:MBL fold metallo-hydrolase [Bacteroidia bacterium]